MGLMTELGTDGSEEAQVQRQRSPSPPAVEAAIIKIMKSKWYL